MQEERNKVIYKTVRQGLSFGAALAMVISYTKSKSVLWAIIHGLLSWGYVVYHLIWG